MGDLSRPAQSLKGFIRCNLPINVGTASALIFAVKIAAAFLSALIFRFLCTAFYSVYAYIAAVVIAVVEVTLYVTIEENSWAAFQTITEKFKNYLSAAFLP